MKRKPILIIHLPYFDDGNRKASIMYQLKRVLQDIDIKKDYYVIPYIDNRIESVDFKLLKTSNIDVEKYEELKTLIKNSVKI